jgi:hypothetical protein
MSQITLGATRVGTLNVEADRVIGAGGYLSPTLIVPLAVTLDARSDDGMPPLARQWIEGRLRLPGMPAGVPVGPTSFRFTGAHGHATIHNGPVAVAREIAIDFALTSPQARAFEEAAAQREAPRGRFANDWAAVVWP